MDPGNNDPARRLSSNTNRLDTSDKHRLRPAGNHTMFDIIATTPYFTDNYLDPTRKL